MFIVRHPKSIAEGLYNLVFWGIKKWNKARQRDTEKQICQFDRENA